jgi:hypothetical protein
LAIGSGLGGSLGVAPETPGSYGTYSAPNHFYKPTKAEVKKVKNIVQGAGIAAGQLVEDGARRTVASQAATASLEMDFTTKTMGLLLQHIFGPTVTPVQQVATAAYLQTHALGDNIGKSLTCQVGLPDRAGTVHPYTLKGGKITSATFACAVNSNLSLALEVDGQLLSEVETLAAPSFATGAGLFPSLQMDVKLGTYGAEAHVTGVKGISLQIARGQQVDAFYAGATVPGTKAEPVTNAFVNVSGSIDIDYVNKADFIDRFASDASTSMVISWTGAIIASTYPFSLTLTCPMTFFDGDTPGLEGPDVLGVSVPFTAQFDQTNAPVSAQYMSTDITI